MNVVKTIISLENKLKTSGEVALSECKDIKKLERIKNYFKDAGYFCSINTQDHLNFFNKIKPVYEITITNSCIKEYRDRRID
jgi:hypothetical protein